ncbi:MAG: hypothetical protein RL220_1268, partial [Bacteroidota bacterium]
MKKFLLPVLVTLICTNAISQNDGDLDNTFNSTGIYTYDFGFQDNLTDVKVQADQKILTCGTSLSGAFAGRLIVMRQNTDGTPDLSFNGTGYVLIDSYTESYAYEIRVRDDGKILIAGAVASPVYIFSALVMRLNADGSIDETFGDNGFSEINLTGTDHFAYAMQETADNKILIAGSSLDANYNNQPVVFRLNEDGSLDETFGENGAAIIEVTQIDNRFNSLTIQDDGKIVAAGHLSNPLTNDGQFDFDILVARFNEDGSPDVSFSGDGILTDAVSALYTDDIFEVVVTPDGNITVAGYATQADFSFDLIVVQYDDSGERVDTFGDQGVVQLDLANQDVALGMDIQTDGKIVVAGTSGGFFFDNRDVLIIRLETNGAFDNTFNDDGIVLTEVLGYMDEANAVTIQADDKIVVAGKDNNGTQNDALLARYEAESEANGIIHDHNASFSIFPNPATIGNRILVQHTEPVSRIVLQDISGKTIAEFQVNKGTYQATLFIPSTLEAGIYMLRVNNEVQRLVV